MRRWPRCRVRRVGVPCGNRLVRSPRQGPGVPASLLRRMAEAAARAGGRQGLGALSTVVLALQSDWQSGSPGQTNKGDVNIFGGGGGVRIGASGIYMHRSHYPQALCTPACPRENDPIFTGRRALLHLPRRHDQPDRRLAVRRDACKMLSGWLTGSTAALAARTASGLRASRSRAIRVPSVCYI